MNGKNFRQKDIDLAMSAVCRIEQKRKPNFSFSAKSLYSYGLPRKIDSEEIVKTLCAMNLVEYKQIYPNADKTMKITDDGKRYLQDMAKNQREFHHNWKIALVSAVSGAFLSEPLWALLRLVWGSLFK